MSCLLDSYSREALEEIVQQSTNFKQVLEKVGDRWERTPKHKLAICKWYFAERPVGEG